MPARRMMVMLALAAPAGVAAQDPELIPVGIPTMVDRVVAIVGNQPVLNSHVEEALFQRQQEGLTLPTDPAGRQQLRAEVIEELISTELLVREAQRDSTIVVTDEEVASAVQKTLASIRRQFSSELEYEEELKKAGFQTPQEFRRYRMEQQRPRSPFGWHHRLTKRECRPAPVSSFHRPAAAMAPADRHRPVPRLPIAVGHVGKVRQGRRHFSDSPGAGF